MNSPRPANPNVAKGAAITLIFVVIGVFLLIRAFGGDDDNEATTPTPDSTSQESSEVVPPTDSGVLPPDTVVIAPTTVPPGNVQVVVANASTVTGSAGRARDQLVAQGFTVTNATNAVEDLPATAVYHRPGMEGTAADIAAILGAKTEQIQLMPIPEPALESPVTPQVHILVMLGQDLAK